MKINTTDDELKDEANSVPESTSKTLLSFVWFAVRWSLSASIAVWGLLWALRQLTAA